MLLLALLGSVFPPVSAIVKERGCDAGQGTGSSLIRRIWNRFLPVKNNVQEFKTSVTLVVPGLDSPRSDLAHSVVRMS